MVTTNSTRNSKECKVEGCGNRANGGAGYCSMHYQRVTKYGECGPPQRLISAVMGNCSVDGCGNKANGGAGYCYMHYSRFKKYGEVGTVGRLRRKCGDGTIMKNGYISIGDKSKRKRLSHRIIAEKAMGKSLPEGVVVHHVDGNRANNGPSNLVICPDEGYHKLLHRRQKAMETSGHADFLKCVFCKKYDDPINLHVPVEWGANVYHRDCANRYAKDRRKLNQTISSSIVT